MQTNEKLSQQYISLFNLFIYVILIIYLSNVLYFKCTGPIHVFC